jgi:hypothetical protein
VARGVWYAARKQMPHSGRSVRDLIAGDEIKYWSERFQTGLGVGDQQELQMADTLPGKTSKRLRERFRCPN